MLGSGTFLVPNDPYRILCTSFCSCVGVSGDMGVARGSPQSFVTLLQLRNVLG